MEREENSKLVRQKTELRKFSPDAKERRWTIRRGGEIMWEGK